MTNQNQPQQYRRPVDKVRGWYITQVNDGPFVRSFTARPENHIVVNVEYRTSERRGSRFIEAIYPARVIGINLRWQWDEESQAWWSQGHRLLRILNEATGEFYKSGWRENPVYQYTGFDAGAELDRDPTFIALLEATDPRSIVTVSEVQA